MCFGAIDIDRFLKNGAKGTGVLNFIVYLSSFSTVGSLPSTYNISLVLVSPYPAKTMSL